MRSVMSVVVMVAVAVATGCNMKPAERQGERGRSIAKASIATFDPDEAIAFDLDAFGTERPDQYAIEQAFSAAYPGMDECVAAERGRRGKDEQLPGDVSMAIKLNPKASKPFAINAEIAEGLSKKLNDCLRDAAAKVQYPTYDGPPTVVKFEFELDPGYVPAEEE
ncbi:MAG TPA: hypothetical protein PKW35_10165 [Nannocystaceae bacterium]|nr:hypothetical protein [Nannocystaceae bacterium]